MKNQIPALIMTGILSLSLIGPASAVGTQLIEHEAMLISEVQVAPRAEQVEWYMRMLDGKMQKRLWSITYGKWLTEWEDM